MKQPIKDGTGKVIGYQEKGSFYDSGGRIVAREQNNRTYDAGGKLVGQGNIGLTRIKK